RPTREDAIAAFQVINELLDEFPFSGNTAAARSVALSMLMTPVLRPALAPAVPLHVATAPAGGTGKSFLADLAAMIATGERWPVLTAAAREEETEKRLHGAALSGQPVIALDNCNGTLRSEFLCQVVERPRIQVRPLGTSNTVTIPNAFTLFANGNNVE